MDVYFNILNKEIKKCKKHLDNYGLQGNYDVFNDAVFCAYQFIEKYHYENKNLLNFAKDCLNFKTKTK